MKRQRQRRKPGLSKLGWAVLVVGVSSAAVLWYSLKKPGPAAKALIAAWLIPGVPPPGPFG